MQHFHPEHQSHHSVTTSVDTLFRQMCTGVTWKVASELKGSALTVLTAVFVISILFPYLQGKHLQVNQG